MYRTESTTVLISWCTVFLNHSWACTWIKGFVNNPLSIMGCLTPGFRGQWQCKCLRWCDLRTVALLVAEAALVSGFGLTAECPCGFHALSPLKTSGGPVVLQWSVQIGRLETCGSLGKNRQEEGEGNFCCWFQRTWRVWVRLGGGTGGNSLPETSLWQPGASEGPSDSLFS